MLNVIAQRDKKSPLTGNSCKFYTKRLFDSNEIGVFAARDFAAGEIIERTVAAMVHRNVTSQTILDVL